GGGPRLGSVRCAGVGWGGGRCCTWGGCGGGGRGRDRAPAGGGPRAGSRAPPVRQWRPPQRQQTRRGTNGDPVRESGGRVRERNEGVSWYLLFGLNEGEREHRVRAALRQLGEVVHVDALG